MASLAWDGVTKRYAGDRDVVRDVCLQATEGQILVVLGPSGSGKTTLLRLAAGLTAPTSGVVRLNGRDANGLPPRDRGVSLAFQEAVLYPHLSVRGNLEFGTPGRTVFGGRARRVTRAGAADRLQAAAQALNLEHLLDRPPHGLSGGERQRVALGRAIVRRSAAFLLDEPLVGLDGPLRRELRRRLVAWQRHERATVVWVTHEQCDALAVADRLALLRGGTLEQVGTPRQIYGRPENVWVAGFVGSPPMNLIRGRCRRLQTNDAGWGPGRWRFEGSGWVWMMTQELVRSGRGDVGLAPGTVAEELNCVLGVRPERLRVKREPDPESAAQWRQVAEGRGKDRRQAGRCPTDVWAALPGRAMGAGAEPRVARIAGWAEVREREWLGNECRLRLSPMGERREERATRLLDARVAVASSDTAGDMIERRVWVEADVRDLYWFDATTGRRWSPANDAASRQMQLGTDIGNEACSTKGLRSERPVK